MLRKDTVMTRSSIGLLMLTLAACGSDGVGDDGGPLGGSLVVTGDVVDFNTNAPVAGAASVSTSGLVPAPRITTQGASFTIEGVPENSAFQILAAEPPSHRATFSPAVIVTDADVDGVVAYTVDEAFLTSLSLAFGVTPSAARGVLFAKLVDASGVARAGIQGTALAVSGGPDLDGPWFLDAQMMPDAGANQTSASGWVIYFEVAPGVAGMAAAGGANIAVDMPVSPINAGTVTIATVKVTDGAVMVPTNVSFSQQVVPIFERRGCTACHSGNNVGNDLGGLALNGGATKVYNELREDPTRVVVGMPETSLVLTMPSREDPPDNHPNVTFSSPTDPDYLLILGWITGGALQN
jgi:hypothetical protein